jgi:hypothetical protein
MVNLPFVAFQWCFEDEKEVWKRVNKELVFTHTNHRNGVGFQMTFQIAVSLLTAPVGSMCV